MRLLIPKRFPRICVAQLRSPFRSAYQCRLASTNTRSWSTPLAKTIAEAINTTGPISLAAYMRQCLTSPEGGYYTTKREGRDQFGQKGDFITSPEISQIFGELIGLWIVAEWMAQGKPAGVDLIEVGPGRGTLMDDILRTVKNFKSFVSSIEAVHLVEASPGLRGKQAELLCSDPASLQESSEGFQGTSKYSSIPISWCEDLRLLQKDSSKAPFIIAHEFFDALPINAFQSVPLDSAGKGRTIEGLSGPIKISQPQGSQNFQWRELMVAPAPTSDIITTSSRPLLQKDSSAGPDFLLRVAKSSNPSSLVLPESSPRYKALKSICDSVIEISPESVSCAADFATRIGGGLAGSPPALDELGKKQKLPDKFDKLKPSGAALIIDYGPASTVPTSSLRGIREHKIVSPFSSPGEVDLSADVDFTALAEAAINASEGVEVHGPVEQGEWLERMGARERIEILCRNAERRGDKEAAKIMKSAADRLMERGGGAMGKIYKVMAIVPEGGGKRRPVGFGGDVPV